MPDVRERPDHLAVAFLLADRDVVARHEVAAVLLVPYLDARQPLDVGHAVPPGSDQAHREAVLLRQRDAVHLVAEEVRRIEGVVQRHAAREMLGDLQIDAVDRESPSGRTCRAVRADRRRCCRGCPSGSSTPKLSRMICASFRSAPQKTTSMPSSRTPACFRSGASGVPAQRALPTPPMKNGRPVLPEHSSVKSTSRRGRALRSASVSVCGRLTRPAIRAASRPPTAEAGCSG